MPRPRWHALPIVPLACALAGTVLSPNHLVAQATVAAQSQGAGSVSGRVANAGTGQYLANAVVHVEGTSLEARTADDGYFRISGLQPGTYTLSADYTGLDRSVMTVVVTGAGDQQVEFNLTSDIYILGEFVVSSSREGSSKAVQDQKEAINVKNIVASDSFGNIVDGNIGELMKNLRGVTIDYDGEDASEIRVRGMAPELASVMMDGNPIATSPGSDTRSFSLRDLAVQNIETIEVNFAPTPRDPANTQGGLINFKTKSSFNQKGRRVRFDANLSLNTEALDLQKTPGGRRTPDRKLMPGFNLSYSEAFGTTRPVGIALNASVSERYRFNNEYRVGGYSYNTSDLAENGGVATPEMQGTVPSVFWTERGQADERKFVSLNLDWKMSDSTSLFLKNSLTKDRGLGSYAHRLTVRAGTQTEDASFDRIVSPTGTTINPSVAVGNNKTDGLSTNFGVSHRFGAFELDYDVYYSESEFAPEKEGNYSLSYNVAPGTGIVVDNVSGNGTGSITQTAGPNYLDIANYQSLSLFQDYTSGIDKRRGGKLNAKFSTTLLGMPIQFEAGGLYGEQSRDIERYYRKWDLTGNSGSGLFGTAAEPNLQQFADPYFSDQWSFDVPIASWLNPHAVYDYFSANPDQFYNNYITGFRDANRSSFITGSFSREQYGKRFTKEQIYAGYGMASVRILPSLTALAGARYERTELSASGIMYDGSNTAYYGAGQKFDSVTPSSPYYGWSDEQLASLLFTRVIGKKSYDKVFPNIQVRYEPIKDLALRASYTTDIGRPDFSNILPGDTIYDHYNLIRRANTDLRPQEGDKINLNAEYYLPEGGLVSLTVFKQDIDGYIYSVVTSEQRLNEETGLMEPWTIETRENAGKASNEGFEIEYRQRLGFLTSALRNFEFRATYSVNDPQAEYLRRTGAPIYVDDPTQEEVDAYMNSPQVWTSIPLANVIEKSGNARISYNGRRLSASVAAFWRDKFARTLNLATLDHVYQQADLRCDLNVTYKIDNHWSAYLDWRNFTNEDDDRRIFSRTGGFYTSGMVVNLGVRANF